MINIYQTRRFNSPPLLYFVGLTLMVLFISSLQASLLSTLTRPLKSCTQTQVSTSFFLQSDVSQCNQIFYIIESVSSCDSLSRSISLQLLFIYLSPSIHLSISLSLHCTSCPPSLQSIFSQEIVV